MSQLPLPDVAVTDEKERFPVSNFTLGKEEKVGERQTQRLDYQLAVKGQNPTFSVTVWIDLKTGLPVKRLVTGGVGEEKLTYSETYNLTLDGNLTRRCSSYPINQREGRTIACTGAADPVGFEWRVTWCRPGDAGR